MARMTTKLFFGGADDRIHNLASTLKYISEKKPDEKTLIDWIRTHTPAGSQENIRHNLSFLESIDLLEATSEGYETTNKGEAFWRHDEPLVMYEGLATGVDGFREICRLIPDGNRTVEEIQHHLRQEYPDHVLPKGVVTRHLDWLKSLDLVTERDGVYSIPIENGQFAIGERYSRWFLHDVFKGERYTGIATPRDHPLIFMFTGDSGGEYGYKDEFLDDDTFRYTGEGTEGDMTMTGGNEAIRTHREHGAALHLFEDTELPWIVTYLGEYEYVSHRTQPLADKHGTTREAVQFTLAPVGGTTIEIEDGTPSSLSDAALFENAKQSTPTNGHSTSDSSGSSSTGRSYSRSDVVREFALRMADGVCQGCNEEAPFEKPTGEPFLEVHHLTRRSDGGPDDPENVIALCPNCHRRVHEGRDGEAFNRALRRTIDRQIDQYR